MIFQEWNIQLGDDDHCKHPAGNRNFTVCTDSFSGASKHKKHTQFNIYTDGRKIDNKVGWGLVVYKHQELIHSGGGALPSTSTVFQAEIEAIRQGGKHLRN